MKIIMTIEVEVDEIVYPSDDSEQDCFTNEVLVPNGTLILHSNELGDEVGIVTSIKNIQYE